MKSFKDFNIKPTTNGFTGDKIKIAKLLNREIAVHAYRIVDSKHNDGKCLHMQICLGENMHVVFTGSNTLMDMINKVPADAFPFTTTIEKDDERLMFT